MFEAFRDWRWHRKASRDRERLIEDALRDKQAVRAKNGSPDDVEMIEHQLRMELDLLDDDIEDRLSRAVIKRGRRYGIAPSAVVTAGLDSDWITSQVTGRYRLTADARRKLVTDIRREQREVREAWGFWVTMAVGVIGALTGLASVLRH